MEQLVLCQQDMVMLCVQKVCHLMNIRIIIIRLKNTFCKIFFVVGIVNREGMQPFSEHAQRTGGEHGQNRGIQTAREKGAQRNISRPLTRGCVFDQPAGMCNGLF